MTAPSASKTARICSKAHRSIGRRHRLSLRVPRMRKGLSAMLLASALKVWAQDPVQIDPKHYKIEYEDAKVRVIRFTLPPGESAPMHSHSERINVIIRGGTVRQTDENGQVTETTGVTGQVSHRDAMSHSVVNIGKT